MNPPLPPTDARLLPGALWARADPATTKRLPMAWALAVGLLVEALIFAWVAVVDLHRNVPRPFEELRVRLFEPARPEPPPPPPVPQKIVPVPAAPTPEPVRPQAVVPDPAPVPAAPPVRSTPPPAAAVPPAATVVPAPVAAASPPAAAPTSPASVATGPALPASPSPAARGPAASAPPAGPPGPAAGVAGAGNVAGTGTAPGGLRGVVRGVQCAVRVQPVYPRRALQEEITGTVLAHLKVNRNGEVEDVVIISANPRRVFDGAVVAAARQYRCQKNDTDYLLEQEFVFNLK